MASIEANTRGNNKTARSRAKHSMHVDLTPMVDLGFLLITFFMLTARLKQEENKLPMLLPENEISGLPLSNSKALTILLKGNETMYYYTGETPSNLDSNKIVTVKDRNRLADAVLKFAKINNVQSAKNLQDSLAVGHVFIKPDSATNYERIILAMDAVMMGQIRSYSIEDWQVQEKKLLH